MAASSRPALAESCALGLESQAKNLGSCGWAWRGGYTGGQFLGVGGSPTHRRRDLLCRLRLFDLLTQHVENASKIIELGLNLLDSFCGHVEFFVDQAINKALQLGVFFCFGHLGVELGFEMGERRLLGVA